MLITKQGETKWNDETDVFLLTNFCFVINEINETEWNRPTPWSVLIRKQGETKWNDETDTFLIFQFF